jgi:hypothetical protein
MADRRIRVLVTTLPPLVRDLLLRSLEACDRIEVLATDLALDLLPEFARSADVVLIHARNGALPAPAEAVLAGHGLPAFIGVAAEDGRAEFVRLAPERTPLGPLTADEIVRAVCRVGEGD